MSFKVILEGFKTKKQAKEFLDWYEGGDEQSFYEHLLCIDKSPDDGCNINVSRKGNKGRYFDVLEDGYLAEVE